MAQSVTAGSDKQTKLGCPRASEAEQEPSLAVRPTQRARQERLRRDLDQPGWVVFSPRGLEASSPLGNTEDSSGGQESAPEAPPKRA